MSGEEEREEAQGSYEGSRTDNDSTLVYKSTLGSAGPSPVLPERQAAITKKKSVAQSSEESSSNESSVEHSTKHTSKASVPFDIDNYKLEFDDLNECVAALLKKAKDD
jgi:hypothetical protein